MGKGLSLLIIATLIFCFSCGIPNPYYVDTQNIPKTSSLTLTNSDSKYYITISEELKNVSHFSEPQLCLFYTITPNVGGSYSNYPVDSLISGFQNLYCGNPNTINIPNGTRPYSRTLSTTINNQSESINLYLNRFATSGGEAILTYGQLISASTLDTPLSASLANPYVWEISVNNLNFSEVNTPNTVNITVNGKIYELYRYNGDGFSPDGKFQNSSYIGNEIPSQYSNTGIQDVTLRIYACVSTGNFQGYTGSYNYIKQIGTFSSDNTAFKFIN